MTEGAELSIPPSTWIFQIRVSRQSINRRIRDSRNRLPQLHLSGFLLLGYSTNLKARCCRRQCISIKNSESFLCLSHVFGNLSLSQSRNAITLLTQSAITVCRSLRAPQKTVFWGSTSQTLWTMFILADVEMQILIDLSWEYVVFVKFYSVWKGISQKLWAVFKNQK